RGYRRSIRGIDSTEGHLDADVRTSDRRTSLAADEQSIRTLEMGFHVSGSAAGEGRRGADGPASRSRRRDPAQRSEVSRLFRVSVCVLGVLCGGELAQAQLQRIKADLTPLLDATGVHAGDTVRAALAVRLPEGFHVQSNKPRDPSLIATDLTVDAPDG